MKPDDLLQPILNTAAVAIKQGVIIGRREALKEVVNAVVAAQNFRDALLAVEALVAKENEKHG